jgi:hypothetical protein
MTHTTIFSLVRLVAGLDQFPIRTLPSGYELSTHENTAARGHDKPAADELEGKPLPNACECPMLTSASGTAAPPLARCLVQFQFKGRPGQSSNIVLRVIGLPGEDVRIVDGEVRIDNTPLFEETYVRADRNIGQHLDPIRVPLSHYFVLGDNRMNSFDSRHMGPIAESAIWGKIINK